MLWEWIFHDNFIPDGRARAKCKKSNLFLIMVILPLAMAVFTVAIEKAQWVLFVPTGARLNQYLASVNCFSDKFRPPTGATKTHTFDRSLSETQTASMPVTCRFLPLNPSHIYSYIFPTHIVVPRERACHLDKAQEYKHINETSANGSAFHAEMAQNEVQWFRGLASRRLLDASLICS
jgi:hypothetical protein